MRTLVEKPAWGRIDTVLLDLDGTLLDLAFDNDFWLEHIPAAFAAARSLTLEAARAAITPQFRAVEGTLPWYCIDHWSRELGLDIATMKEAESGRIRWLPGAQGFLRSVRSAGKRVVLITNSHPQVLGIKDRRTGVTGFMDAAFSSHQFGAPKESPEFWTALRTMEPFDPQRTLFADDSLPVLRAAQAAGIRWIYGVRRADSSREARDHGSFPAVDAVSDLAPGSLC
jgi:putative hydrolase of the HAD superfamily